MAEHLARGVDAILAATGDVELAAYFSLHDGHEAILKDDTTPKKRALAELAEEKFGVLAAHVLDCFALLTYRPDVAIHEAAGLAWPMPPALVAQVKRWDLVMFVTKWRDLMGDRPHPNRAPYSGILPLRDVIAPWRWETAKTALLKRWNGLLPALIINRPDDVGKPSSAIPGPTDWIVSTSVVAPETIGSIILLLNNDKPPAILPIVPPGSVGAIIPSVEMGCSSEEERKAAEKEVREACEKLGKFCEPEKK